MAGSISLFPRTKRIANRMNRTAFVSSVGRPRGLRSACAWIVSGWLVVLPAHAQLRLPGLPVPLPSDRIIRDPGGLLRDPRPALAAITPPQRLLQVSELLRRHRDVIDTDPAGEPIVRGEVLALSPSDDALARLAQAGFAPIREHILEGLDDRIVVLRPPAGMGSAEVIQRLHTLDPEGTYDFNHLYSESGDAAPVSGATPSPPERPRGRAEPPSDTAKIGLIDGGVDLEAAALARSTVVRWGCSGRAVPSLHGTAVASLIVGRARHFRGVTPAARLYAADVYCNATTGGAVDTIVDAFSWMVQQQIPVISISLVGPQNRMLEHVIRKVMSRGHIVVAAVGNDGPAAPPLYPASYPGVIGVTAVDAGGKVLAEAARGPQVAFAAPGADMAAASPEAPGYVRVRGTSFAVPIVAGLLAENLREPDPHAAQVAVEALAHSAMDSGATGKDSEYGFGVVGMVFRVDPAKVP